MLLTRDSFPKYTNSSYNSKKKKKKTQPNKKNGQKTKIDIDMSPKMTYRWPKNT